MLFVPLVYDNETQIHLKKNQFLVKISMNMWFKWEGITNDTNTQKQKEEYKISDDNI